MIMFGKLMKYELKDCMRVFLPLWGAVLVLAAFNGFTLGRHSSVSSPILQFLVNILPMLLFFGLSFGMFIVAFILIIRRFYNGLLGDGGYLAFTLPVTHRQHITSKLLTALIMVAGCTIAGILASLIVFMLQNSSFQEMMREFFAAVRSVFAEYPSSPLFILEIIVMIIVYLCHLILRLYSGMAVGHLFGNHRGGWSAVAVIVTGWIINLSVTGLIRLSGMLDRFSSEYYVIDSLDRFFEVIPGLFGAVIVFFLIWDIILWIVTEWILKKKLNIL